MKVRIYKYKNTAMERCSENRGEQNKHTLLINACIYIYIYLCCVKNLCKSF